MIKQCKYKRQSLDDRPTASTVEVFQLSYMFGSFQNKTLWGKQFPHCNFLESRSDDRGNGFSHQWQKKEDQFSIINGTITTSVDFKPVFGSLVLN